jgi:hypothetical protein
MEKHEIKWGDMIFQVSGIYTEEEKGTYESPCYPHSFEIVSVSIKDGIDIEYMLNDYALDNLETLILEQKWM